MSESEEPRGFRADSNFSSMADASVGPEDSWAVDWPEDSWAAWQTAWQWQGPDWAAWLLRQWLWDYENSSLGWFEMEPPLPVSTPAPEQSTGDDLSWGDKAAAKTSEVCAEMEEMALLKVEARTESNGVKFREIFLEAASQLAESAPSDADSVVRVYDMVLQASYLGCTNKNVQNIKKTLRDVFTLRLATIVDAYDEDLFREVIAQRWASIEEKDIDVRSKLFQSCRHVLKTFPSRNFAEHQFVVNNRPNRREVGDHRVVRRRREWRIRAKFTIADETKASEVAEQAQQLRQARIEAAAEGASQLYLLTSFPQLGASEAKLAKAVATMMSKRTLIKTQLKEAEAELKFRLTILALKELPQSVFVGQLGADAPYPECGIDVPAYIVDAHVCQ